MKLAISEAQKGFGKVSPNPPVGCVVLSPDGDLISKGYHRHFGGNHAEIEALEKIEEETLKGAQVFISLEPCSYEGKTPSCAKRLAALPIAGVYYGSLDPNPRVNGAGIEILKNAGKRVTHLSECEEDAKSLIEVFSWNVSHNLPFVAGKVGITLDGHLAHSSGKSQWITGEESRKDVHLLRAQYDSVLIGKETLLLDDPSLNSRLSEYRDLENWVIVFDQKGSLLDRIDEFQISKVRDKSKILFVVDEELKHSSSIAFGCPVDSSGFFDIPELLKRIYKKGIYSILVEGGARALSSFVEQKSLHQIYCYIAPIILGGKSGINWMSDVFHTDLGSAMYLENVRHKSFGNDIRISGRTRYK